MMLSTLFYHPIVLSSGALPWLMLPLCISVAIVYKTLRARQLKDIPLQVLYVVAYIAAGLSLLGAGLWLIQVLWA